LSLKKTNTLSSVSVISKLSRISFRMWPWPHLRVQRYELFLFYQTFFHFFLIFFYNFSEYQHHLSATFLYLFYRFSVFFSFFFITVLSFLGISRTVFVDYSCIYLLITVLIYLFYIHLNRTYPYIYLMHNLLQLLC
jgi:hypothetical protein